MHAPLYSTITLFAELIVSSLIYYTLYQGYKHNKFPTKVALVALGYEIIFNISYMIMQVPNHTHAASKEAPAVIGLAIVHGILSLVMFLSLIAFFILAWRKYKNGNNFFRTHTAITTVFTIFWTISVVSGVLFYLVEYIL